MRGIKFFTTIITVAILLLSANVYAQLTGVNTINPSGSNTVGNPAGVAGANYTSFTNAVAALTSYGVGGGPVTFNVSSATYSEQFTIGAITNASATNTITFQSASGDSSTVNIVFAGTSTNNYVLQVTNAQYVTFQKLTFRNTNTTYSRTLLINGNTTGANYLQFLSNRFISISTTGSSSNNYNIYSPNSYNVQNVLFQKNFIQYGSAGLYINGNSSSNVGINIDSNNIVDFGYYGVYCTYQKYLQIRYNTIQSSLTSPNCGVNLSYCGVSGVTMSGPNVQYNNIDIPSSTVTTYGLYSSNSIISTADWSFNNISLGGSGTKYGFYGSQLYYGCRFRNNTFDISSSSGSQYGLYMPIYNGNDGSSTGLIINNIIILHGATTSVSYGIYWGGSCYGSVSYRYIVANNMISQYNGTGQTYGIYTNPSGGYTDFVFNSVNIAGTNTASIGYSLYSDLSNSTYSNIVFKNNIASCPGGGYAVEVTNNSNGFTYYDNNDYYTTGTNIGKYLGTNISSFSNWVNLFGNDLNSINLNPNFTSTTDLHISNPNLQRGSVISTVTTDYDGQTRDTITPYIGADELSTTAMSYASATTLQYNTKWLGIGSTKNEIICVRVTTNGTTSPLQMTSLSLSPVSTILTDISNAKVFYTGSNATFDTAAQFGSKISSPGSSMVFTGSQSLVPGNNYFWLSLDIPIGATLYDTVDAQCTGMILDSAGNALSKTAVVTNPAGFRKIGDSLSGVYTINPVGSGSRNFANFATASNALTQLGISGACTFNVSTGTYTEQIYLSAIPGITATKNVVFQSTSSDSTAVAITFAGTSAANYVLKLYGASYVTFRKMTFQNTGTTYSRVVELANAANYNKFFNNRFIGYSISSTADQYAIIYSTTTSGTKCEYDTFKYNRIMNGSIGITLLSTVGNNSSNNCFDYNTIYNFGGYGVNIQNMSYASINNNYFETYLNALYGLQLNYLSNYSMINYNTINLCGSTPTYGIYHTNSNSNNQVKYNVVNIPNLSGSSTIYGYYASSSNTNNEISNNSFNFGGSHTGMIFGIYGSSCSSNYYNNNTINFSGPTGTLYGVYLQSSNNNQVNGNNIRCTSAFTGTFYGIYTTNASGGQYNNNTINALYGNNGTNNCSGLYLSSVTNNAQINGNNINLGGAGYKYGIYATSCYNGNTCNGNTIDITTTSQECGLYLNNFYLDNAGIKSQVIKNKIYLRGATTATSYGIYYYNSYGNTATAGRSLVANNFIALTNVPVSTTVYGFYSANSGNNDIFYNNISINGGSTSSAGMYFTASSSSANYRNNMVRDNISFVKSGTSNGGYANYVANTANQTPFNFNYNDYYTNGTNLGYWNGTNCTSLTTWKSTSKYDTSGLAVNPFFRTTTDLHTSNPALIGVGITTALISDDIDTNTRNASPCIGACEFTVYTTDAGVTAFTPNSSGVLCAGSIAVTGTVINFGTDTLKTVVVKWKINYNGSLNSSSLTGLSIPSMGPQTFSFGAGNFNVWDSLYMWTESPNGGTDSNTSNDLLKDNLNVKLNGTYTIGGTSPKYSSIAAAINDAVKFGICGPTTFLIRQGTYTGNYTIPSIPGSSYYNTVTFMSDPANTQPVILQYAASSTTDNFIFKFNGTSYITIKKLTLKNTGAIYSTSLYYTGTTNYIVIDSNKIYGRLGATTSSYDYIISGSSGANLQNYNTISNNIIKYGSYAIYIYGNSVTARENRNTILNNQIDSFYNYGIYAYYQDSLTINGNYINSIGQYSTEYGMYLYYTNMALNVFYNRIYLRGTTSSYGIYSYYHNNNGSTTYSTVRGNIINNYVSITTSTSTLHGIYVYYPNYMNIFHNTVNITAPYTSGYGMYIYTSNATYHGNVNARNNLLINNGGGFAVFLYESGVTTNRINYNNYYASGTNLCSYNSTAYTTLAAWKAACTKDTSSINYNVTFVPSIEPRHFQSNMKTGQLLSYVPTDIYGTTRVSPATIGACEYIPSSYDAGISGIVSPVYPVCIGSTPIIVSLFNYGTNTLTSDTILWSINGVPQSPYYWTGSLATMTGTTVIIDTFSFTSGIYNFSAWVSKTINGSFTDPQPANDMSTRNGLTIGLAGGTYTINPSLSRSSMNYLTITDAVNDLNYYGVCGPVTFLISQGTYIGNYTLNKIYGASNINRVTFRPDFSNTQPVILAYSATAITDNFVFTFKKASFISIKGLTLKNTGAGYGKVFDFLDSTYYVIIDSNKIYGRLGATTAATDYVIYDNSGTANIAYYCTFSNNTIKYGSYGIYWYGGSSTVRERGNSFINNTIDSFYYMGLYTLYQDSLTITKNFVNSLGQYTTEYGMYIYYSWNQLNISQNRVFVKGTSTNYGIYVNYYNYNPMAFVKGTIYNNFISINKASATNYGLYINYPYYLNVFHNTVNIVSGLGASRSMYFYTPGTTTGNSFIRNNIFINNAGGVAMYLQDNSPTTNYINYNDYYTNGANICSYGGTNYANLSDWQVASMKDTNSINLDVPFFSATDPRHYSTTLRIGAAGTGITTDLYETTRPATPTLGAYEYVPPGYDAGILSFTSLSSPLCPDTTNIVVSFANLGTNLLTSDTIGWMVNGITQSPDYAWIGTLASGVSTNITLGTYVFSPGIDYTIKAYTKGKINGLYTDPLALNDTAFRYNVRNGLAGTYTINSTLPKSATNFTSFSDAVTSLANGGVCGSPVVFNVAPGTYTEQIDIPVIAGVSATNTITFQGTNDSTAVTLTSSVSTASANFTLRLNGSNYIIFRKMTLSNTNPTYSRVLDLSQAASNNQFLNLRLVGISTTSNTTQYAVVYIYNTQCQYNTFMYDRIINGSMGFYLYGISSSYSNGNVIKYCYLKDFNYYGIYSYYQNGLIASYDTLQTSSTGAYAGFYLGVNYYYCQFNNNYINFPNSTSALYGIYASSCYYNNQFYNNTILLPAAISTLYGIYLTSCYYSNMVYDNYIIIAGAASSTVGIYLNSCRYGNQVNGNTINVSSGSSVIQYGIYLNNVYYENGPMKITVNNNKISLKGATSGTSYGLYLTSVYPSNTAIRIQVFNNFISQANGTGMVYGIYASNGGYIDYYFNSINILGTNTGNMGIYLNTSSSNALYCNSKLRNNISYVAKGYAIAINSTSMTSYCPIYSTSAPLTYWCNYNNWYTTGTNIGQWGGTNYTTFAAWKTASLVDTNSINIVPGFVSSYDLHVNNTSLNVGQKLWEVSEDIDDDDRAFYTTDPYIGADEYVPNVTYSTSIVQQPDTSNVTPGSTNNPVIAIKIVTNGYKKGLKVTQLTLNTTGTTSGSDLTKAAVYYSGNNATFSMATLFDTTIHSPSGTFYASGSQILDTGTVYFWLTYDISSSATIGNYVDAQCTSIRFDSSGAVVTKTPTDTNPAGARRITNVKVISSIICNQANTPDVYPNTTDNPILRLDFNVTGTSGTLNLDSIAVTANNTDNADVTDVKLFVTSIPTFSTATQLGTTQTLVSGKADFHGFSTTLPVGTTYVWVTYDVPSTATWYNLLDTKIAINSIRVSGNTYATGMMDPTGYSLINQAPLTLPYVEDFETATSSFTYTINTQPLSGTGLKEWKFQTTLGRLVMDATPATYNHTASGSYAALLDVATSGTSGTSAIITTLNLSNYADALDMNFSFWYRYDIYRQLSLGDGVWIRGNDTASWIFAYDIAANRAADATWKNSTFDVSAALQNEGQFASSTFQVKFQYASSLQYGTESVVFDDINLTGTVPSNTDAGVLAVNQPIVPFASGKKPVQVTIKNYGLNTLTSAQVNWTANGVAQTPVSWSGSLLPGQTILVTLDSFVFPAVSTTFKFYTTLPNGIADTKTENDTLIQIIAPGLSGIYTIGGTSPNFNTPIEAVNYMQSYGVLGKVTFNIRSGTYTGQIYITAIPGASLTNNITFQSQTGDSNSVIITSSNSLASNNYTLKLFGANYLTFKKITISNTNTTYGRVVELAAQSNYNSFVNNVLNGVTTTSNTDQYAVVYSFGNTGTTQCRYDTFRNNRILNGSIGIYFYSASTYSSYNAFEYNYIKDCYYYGIYTYYQYSSKFRYNTVISDSAYYGLYIFYSNNYSQINNNSINLGATSIGSAIYTNNCSTGVQCNNNIINMPNVIGGPVYGIFSESSNIGNQYNNNVINISGPVTNVTVGLQLISCITNIQINNNTINIPNSKSSTWVIGGIVVSNVYNNCQMLNNNILISSMGQPVVGISAVNYYNGSWINGNTVDISTSANPQYGMAMTNFSQAYNSINNQLLQNKVYLRGTTSTTSYGMWLSTSYGTVTATGRNLIANNFIAQENGTGQVYGLYLTNSGYTDVFYNSINLTGDNTANVGMYFTATASSANNMYIRILNNISHVASGVAMQVIPTYTPVMRCNYNDYFTTGATLAILNTTNYSNLASWIAASTFDTNSLNLNVIFNSSTDLRHTNTSLKTGTPIGIVTTDIFGTSRVTPPTIGAYEFIQYPYDAGISIITNPTAPICPGPTSISVNLTNYGLNTITSDTIRWKINGVVQTPYTWTGSITPGNRASITIGSYSFLAGINYTIMVYSSRTVNGTNADGNSQNDTAYIYDVMLGLSAGTYTIDPSLPASATNFQSFGDAALVLNNGGICGGPVIFNVASGTYNEQVLLGNIQGTSSANTITFKSASGDSTSVILTTAVANLGSNYTVKLNGTNFVTFKKMTIQNTNSIFSRVIVLSTNASSNQFLNDVLIGLNVASNSDQYAVVYSYQTMAQYNTFKYCRIINGSYGIYLYGKSSAYSNNNSISYCYLTNYAYGGFYGLFQYGLQLTYDTITTTANLLELIGIYTNNCQNHSNINNNYINLYNSTKTNIGIGCYNNHNGCQFNNNTIIFPSLSASAIGMAIYNSSYSNQYNNNFIDLNASGSVQGIRSTYSNYGNQINNNIVNVSSSSGNQYGVFLSNWLYENGANKSTLLNNKISMKGTTTSNSYGIYYENCYGNTLRNLIANNFISQANSESSTVFGIYSYNSGWTDVYYNSINITSGSTTSAGLYFYTSSSGNPYQYIRVLNNISSVTGGGFAIYISSSSMSSYPPVSICNYNDLYATGTYLGYWGAASPVNCANIATWKSNSLMDANSISINPFYTSTYDLHITLPALNNGMVVPEVTTDIDNENRANYTVKPYIGADEFNVINNDIGIAAIVNPIGSICGTNTNITVTLKNYGTVTLTSDTIWWKLNAILQAPYSWTGTLAPGSSINVTLCSYTFTPGIKYSITAFTSKYMNGTGIDSFQFNDAYTIRDLYVGISGNVTVGGTSPTYSTIQNALTDLSIKGICGNVNVYIRQGNYSTSFIVNPIPNASPGNILTIMPDPANTAPVIYTNTANNYVVWFNDSKYITLKGLTLRNPHTPNNCRVIIFSGQNYMITIDSNRLYGGLTRTYFISEAIISSASQDNTDISSHITIKNNLLKYGSCGIYTAGGFTSPQIYETGNVIQNNIIDSVYNLGISNIFQDSLTIIGNTITDIGISSAFDFDFGIYLIRNNNAKILNNKVILRGGALINAGIHVTFSNGTPVLPSLIANNYVSIYNSNMPNFGIWDSISTYYNIYHNSFNLTTGIASSSAIFVANSVNQNIMNNIASNSGGGSAVTYMDGGIPSNCNFNYNDYYTSGASLGKYNNFYYPSLIDWSSATGGDFNSIGVIPGFNSMSNPTVSNLALKAGKPSLGITTDIFGTTRATKPTMGAYEIVYDLPVAQTDSANAITSSTATLFGNVNANNASSTVNFEYGLSTAYGTSITAPQSPVAGSTVTLVSTSISGLTPNQTYHYRVNATNVAGTHNGNDKTFTTKAGGRTIYLKQSDGITPIAGGQVSYYSGGNWIKDSLSNGGVTDASGMVTGVPVKETIFKMQYNGTDSTIYSSAGIINFQTCLARVYLKNSRGTGLPGAIVYYLGYNGWQLLDTTDLNGLATKELLPGSHYYTVSDGISSLQSIGTQHVCTLYTFTLGAADIYLLSSIGTGLSGANVYYYANGWQFLGTTDGTGLATKDLFPGSYSFKIEYAGTQSSTPTYHNINSSYTFYTCNAQVYLKSSTNAGISGATIKYLGTSGWITLGITDGSGLAFKELLPGNYYYTIDYAFNTYTSSPKSACTPFTYNTTNAIVNLKSSLGAGLANGDVYYYSSGNWRFFGTTNGSGVASSELLAGSYNFNMKYANTQAYSNHHISSPETFTTCNAKMEYLNNLGVGITGATIYYFGYSGWSILGITNASGLASKELLPQKCYIAITSEPWWSSTTVDLCVTYTRHLKMEAPDAGKSTISDFQVYPNPASDWINIDYSLDDESPVNILLFDVAGNKVAEIFNAKETKGPHLLNWNTGKLASGMYYCKILTNGYNKVKPIVIGK